MQDQQKPQPQALTLEQAEQIEAKLKEAQIKKQALMGRWKERVEQSFAAERERFVSELGNEEVPPRGYDVDKFIHSDLMCEAIDATPLPYILNIGCGFRPASMGWRTAAGMPLNIVGVDPTAFRIGDTITNVAPHLTKLRRFIAPIVAEEINALFPPESFEAVWSDGVLLDVLDPFRVLQQATRVVKPGGVVCMKFSSKAADTLWKVEGFNGGKIVFQLEDGTLSGIEAVRGERVEVHTMIDGDLMIKIRKGERQLERAAKDGPRIILPNS